ncbi:MAG TPA: uracil phosphoribosyltransferase [Ilumatobacteraceae bacterium]|nr:uracil phosphoribosyltransferase [Ilumatobacteraceae bacterium]
MSVEVHLVEHPLAAASLTKVRDENTPNAIFRQELERIGTLVLVEATRNLATHTVEVKTPVTMATGAILTTQPVVIPVLRAGLGFLHAAQVLLPGADVGFVGISRDEVTFEPKPYVNKLPESFEDRVCIVLDPMLATGGSLGHTCKLLKDHGARGPIITVCALAAPEGILHLHDYDVDIVVYTASIDERLNENKFIVPGLGDAGDRQFGAA